MSWRSAGKVSAESLDDERNCDIRAALKTLMPPIPESELILRAKQILLPLTATEDEREALLIDAFYLLDPRLFYEIDRKGPASIFLILLLKKLIDFGLMDTGEHCFIRLLLTAREKFDVDRHAEFDELIEDFQLLRLSANDSMDSSPKPTVVPSPASEETIETPGKKGRPTVFIIYTQVDAEFANTIISDLRAKGHACWVDTGSIKGGDEWIRTIAEGIRNSYAVVVIVTKNAIESRWVQDEIYWAQKKNKPFIPLLRENVIDETRYFPLNGYQPISIDDSNYQIALTNVLAALPDAPRERDLMASFGKSSQIRLDPRKVELAYLERLRLEALLNTEKIPHLAGSSQQPFRKGAEMRTVFELLPSSKDNCKQEEPKQFEDAVAEISRIRRVVLLGKPGGGKTTTIWKLAADLVSDAIADRKAPIPVLVRLGRWTEPEQSLTEFISSQLGDLGDRLDDLLREKRASLLLDGLNELPAGQRDVKYLQVKHLIEAQPELLAIVSCRDLDYTVDLGFDRIKIMPLDPLRIREFVWRCLGEEKGERLFWKLAGIGLEDLFRQFAETFAGKLSDPARTFWVESKLPETVKEDVYWLSEDGIGDWRDWIKRRESLSNLIGLASTPYILMMLTSVYVEQDEFPENRGELFRLFVETLLNQARIPGEELVPLTEGLAKVAYEMQIRRADDNPGDVLTVLPKQRIKEILSERLLYLAGHASVLIVGEQVHFTHQLLQEYFAARYIDLETLTGRLMATKFWTRKKWLVRTNWEEAATLLAGLYNKDCSHIVEWIAEANPEAAAICVKRSGADLDNAIVERLRSKWIHQLTDVKGSPEPKARAAVGRALGMVGWDDRRGVGVWINQNGLALPDIEWVEIPAGEFQYGDKSEDAANPRKMTLPIFYVSRYPITYSQFQTFLDDPMGYADPRWVKGLAAGNHTRMMDEQRFKFSNHPLDSVSWYQATAFCRWFSWRLGGGTDLKKVDEWAVRLPTEFEWEKAARGTDGRLYPYQGDYNPRKGNTDNYIGQTTAVGVYPNGASPYGLMDVTGNVLEWCLSSYRNPQIESQKENLSTDESRVLRGGSWFAHNLDARAVFRYAYRPARRYFNFGFRVLCVVDLPSL